MTKEPQTTDSVSDLQDRMLTEMEKVIDPELRVDLVSLGLIYGLSMTDGVVTVTMTLTTMGCPISDVLANLIQAALENKVAEVKEVKIDLVWEPAWTPAKMS
ncbi:metal-sulfur cluster assembly factor [Paucilactobacillus nenjiangensis]|uniref:metal-sulfur cluster assembly factor n=1 Tax=Paucilactobacillus nenjiangensis TaxID=1296540 RepID=UPI0010F6B926|nr:iron-sulfur cluster assembly protein [Paucilactobacillus nenjiangensis]